MSRKCQPSGDVALNDLDPSRDNFFFFLILLIRTYFPHKQDYKKISAVVTRTRCH